MELASIAGPQGNSAGFNDEIAKAETAFSVSVVTAKILSEVATQSKKSADQLKHPTDGLPALATSSNTIATNIGALGQTTIASRGDAKSPLCVATTDGQPLTVQVDAKTATVITNFLEVISNISCIKESVDELIRAVKDLQEQYKVHHHVTQKNHTASGHPIPAFEPVAFKSSASLPGSGAD
jgi:hypothetical protein